MTIEEIEILMDKFYDLDEDVDEQVFNALNAHFGNDKNGFIDYINSRPIGQSSHRAILYEHIMNNASGWEEFLYEQIRLIIDAIESGNKDAEDELPSLYYLTNISDLKKSFYTKSIEYLRAKLNSRNNSVRKVALEHLLDLHFESKIDLDYSLRDALQYQLYDKNYNVRLYAYLNLNDFNLVPKNFKLRLMDRIRIKMSADHRSYLKAKKIGHEAARKVMNNEL